MTTGLVCEWFVLSLLLFRYQALAQVTASFTFYPLASQQCLNNAAQLSGCPLEAATSYDINHCLCSNSGSFITNTATCVNNNDPIDLQAVWSTMNTACGESQTPIAYTESEFLSVGKGTTTSSTFSSTTYTTPTPTTMTTSTRAASSASSTFDNNQVSTSQTSGSASTSTSTSSSPLDPNSAINSSNGNVGHLSSGMIALIGSVAGVLAVVVGIFACCGCARRARY